MSVDVSPHFYADDTQLLASTKPQNVSAVRQQLRSCVADVSRWCAARRLTAQLGQNRSYVDWLEDSHQRTDAAWSLTDCQHDATINSTDVVRDLGVSFDTELSMKQHITKVLAVCFYHIQGESEKVAPWGFLTFFLNGWEFLDQILRACCTVLSTIDYKFLLNYLQL